VRRRGREERNGLEIRSWKGKRLQRSAQKTGERGKSEDPSIWLVAAAKEGKKE